MLVICARACLVYNYQLVKIHFYCQNYAAHILEHQHCKNVSEILFKASQNDITAQTPQEIGLTSILKDVAGIE